jgi:hypothetical protein
VPAFIAGRKPPVPAIAGYGALELVYAAIDSFRFGKRIPVQKNFLNSTSG